MDRISGRGRWQLNLYLWINPNDPLTYNRMLLPASALRDEGFRVSVNRSLTPAAFEADAVIAADRPGEELPVFAWMARQVGLPLYIDAPNGVQDPRTSQRAQVIDIPTSIPESQLDYQPRSKGRLVIGWTGQHEEDAQLIGTTVRRMVREHDVEFRTVGLRNNVGLTKNYRHIYRSSSYEQFYKSLGFDIALSPHVNPPANPAYTELLLLCYAAAGTPVIATETRGTEFISNGFNGQIAGEPADWRLYDWNRLIAGLVTDEQKRTTLSNRAKEMASFRTMNNHLPHYERLLYRNHEYGGPKRKAAIERLIRAGRKNNARVLV